MAKMSTDVDAVVRAAVFDWLGDLRGSGRSHFPRLFFRSSFWIDGRQLALMDRQKGIWNPEGLRGTLSVTSTLRAARQGLYSDVLDEGRGAIRYSFQGGAGLTNAALRRAARESLPIVHFTELPGRLYSPSFPVYVSEVPGRDYVLLSYDRAHTLDDGVTTEPRLERSYVERSVWRRLHQPAFRGLVLDAYAEKCAVCTFSHPELLDAAHILGDRHPLGDPVAGNGMALCKMHHAAYDKNLIGISPGFQVQVAPDVLAEINGPMLRHGIQEMHGRPLHVPKRAKDRPDRDRLEERFREFQLLGSN